MESEKEKSNEQWFDYLTNIFHEEHDLTRVILIGKDNAVRVLAREDSEKNRKTK